MNRDKTLDFAKGIGIILVVLGQSYRSPNWLTQLINAFHMPCFFLVSGMLYRAQFDRKGSCIFRLRSKVKALLLPWLVWGCSYQTFFGILRVIGGESPATVFGGFLHAFLTLGMGAVWFLPALFAATWLFLATLSRPKLNLCVTTVCLLAGLFGPAWEGFANTVLRAMLACGFFGIGFYGRALLHEKRYPLSVLACLTIVFVLLARLNGSVAMYKRALCMPPLFLLNGILGSLLLIQFCQRIAVLPGKAVDALAVLGQKSMVILCVHQMLLEVIWLADHKLTGGMIRQAGLWEGLVLTAIVTTLIACFFPLCDRYFYTLFGYQKQEKKNHV